MANLSALEKRIFDDIFGLPSGYVLSFTNLTYAEFFKNEIGINIYDVKYSAYGDSKAKRLRVFWEKESDKLVGKVLEELLKVWEYENPKPTQEEKDRYIKALNIAARLQGKIVDVIDDVSDFLKKNFNDINFEILGLSQDIETTIKSRLKEAEICLKNDAPLSVIFLSGSILEALLLNAAINNPKIFNQAESAPNNNNKVKQYHEWTLSDLINVAYETKFLKLDVKKFSHELRNFRNYIHPFEQVSSKFNPSKHTAEICMKVLRAAVADLCNER